MNCFGAGFSCSATNPLVPVLLGGSGDAAAWRNRRSENAEKMHFSSSFEMYGLTDNLQANVLFRERILLALLPVTLVFCDLLMKMKTEKRELFACWGGLQFCGYERQFRLQ